jgi:hypothetical protein
MTLASGSKIAVFLFLILLVAAVGLIPTRLLTTASGQTDTAAPTPTPEPAFDRKAAVEKIRESIKGKENEPAENVFKNIQIFKGVPAGRIIPIMGGGFSRSLGVDCTHCHTPGDWSSDSKQPKVIARDMKRMADTINGEILKNMKSLGERQAIVNCTTCHRGDVKPATNMPRPEGQ